MPTGWFKALVVVWNIIWSSVCKQVFYLILRFVIVSGWPIFFYNFEYFGRLTGTARWEFVNVQLDEAQFLDSYSGADKKPQPREE